MDAPSDCIVLLDELRRAERHAVVSRLSSAFAHLMGTPLNVIAGRAALIKSDPTGANTLENAGRIEQQVERLASLVRSLVEYWGRYEVDGRLGSARAILGDAVSLSKPVAAARKLEISVSDTLPDVLLEATPTLIVLTNLLGLSTFIAPSGSSIHVAASRFDEVSVLFALTVPTFVPPSSRIDRLDPPETKDDQGSAEGLQALSICHAVAERSGARLDVRAGDRDQIQLRCPAR